MRLDREFVLLELPDSWAATRKEKEGNDTVRSDAIKYNNEMSRKTC